MTKPTTVLLSLHYLPAIPYFVAMLKHEKVIIEQHENFQKQSYRNRFEIQSSQKIETLSIPVVKANSRQSMREVRIDPDKNWGLQHWRSVQTCYGKAPFFDHYAPYFHSIWENPPEMLWDLNQQFLTLCLKLLDFHPEIGYSDNFEKIPEDMLDLREAIHPKKPLKTTEIYRPTPYIQNFGKDFVPHLSIIDLLMCEGPNAMNILRQSVVE